jgi:glycosyltransferase involved in cell wall biosynthesis
MKMTFNSDTQKKLLLVTSTVDFGSKTWEIVFPNCFSTFMDVELYNFASDPERKSKNQRELILKRLLATYELWQRIHKAQNEGRKILFLGISPALYAYPALHYNGSYILTDWTRKLYDCFDNNYMSSPDWLTFIHKKVLNKQKYIIGLTEAVVQEINKDYEIPRDKIKKAKFPFCYQLEFFKASVNRQDEEVRILFVGGDFYRKGGNILLQWFKRQNNPNIKLTIVTKSSVENYPKVTIKNNIDFYQPEHAEILKHHDIFVLPTDRDAYPLVLGEAACAGLAILTTKNALGAPEVVKQGINGYICDSQEQLLKQLESLIANKPLIESFKKASRNFMENEFSSDLVLNQFLHYLFED